VWRLLSVSARYASPSGSGVRSSGRKALVAHVAPKGTASGFFNVHQLQHPPHKGCRQQRAALLLGSSKAQGRSP
jgi:hypothetical protein